jgi:hypothetical protein
LNPFEGIAFDAGKLAFARKRKARDTVLKGIPRFLDAHFPLEIAPQNLDEANRKR